MQERNLCSLGITVAPLFQNNAMFLLTIMLIYDDSLLSGQPPLSGHLPAPRVWPLREVAVSSVGNEAYVSLCLVSRENRWKKRGIALTPTKFGIAFGATFLNQVGRRFTPRRMPL